MSILHTAVFIASTVGSFPTHLCCLFVFWLSQHAFQQLGPWEFEKISRNRLTRLQENRTGRKKNCNLPDAEACFSPSASTYWRKWWGKSTWEDFTEHANDNTMCADLIKKLLHLGEEKGEGKGGGEGKRRGRERERGMGKGKRKRKGKKRDIKGSS